jgi:hypothetical protein
MSGRFECRFAVGDSGLAFSAVWLVFTAKKQSDLYIAVKALSGILKATVHRPRPPKHMGYERHFGVVGEASDMIADGLKADNGGRHVLRWAGYRLGSTCTLEYKIRVRGISLASVGLPVSPNVKLLPMPRAHECIDIGVLLGEPGSSFPKEINGGTRILDRGHLSDGSPVWIIYAVYQIMNPGEPLPPPTRITPKKSYFDTNAEITGNTRAILFGEQPDGSLGFMDCRRYRSSTRSGRGIAYERCHLSNEGV